MHMQIYIYIYNTNMYLYVFIFSLYRFNSPIQFKSTIQILFNNSNSIRRFNSNRRFIQIQVAWSRDPRLRAAAAEIVGLRDELSLIFAKLN